MVEISPNGPQDSIDVEIERFNLAHGAAAVTNDVPQDEAFASFVVDTPLRYMALLRRHLMAELGLSKEDATGETVFAHDMTALQLMSPTIRNPDGSASVVIVGEVDPASVIHPGYVPKCDRQQG